MTVNLAVAGLGWLGESLIKDVPRVPAFRVTAVQDVVPGRAEQVAAQYAIDNATNRFEALLADAAIDAVLICTPNTFHAEQAQSALRAGKHVLVQKPLSLTFSDAVATLEVARHARRMLFVDYTYRFLDTMHRLRDAISDPRRVTRVQATFHNIYGPGPEKAWFFDARLSGGGALTDLGVHLLDLGLWLLQPRDARLVAARLEGDAPVETAAHLDLLLDGIPFGVDVSWNTPLAASEISLDVHTRDGHVRWENVDGSFFRFRTLRDGQVLTDRETTLREDTLAAFAAALESGVAPPADERVYALLDQAYGRMSAAQSNA